MDLSAKNKQTLRTKRLELGLNQTQFWGEIGVTQSAGCRYESNSDSRTMPKTVRRLLVLVYGIELSGI